MGERQVFQPLTREDRITVVLYRIGIVLSAAFVAGLAFLAWKASAVPGMAGGNVRADVLLYGLQASVGMCVFFIHLYIGKFKRFLKNLYFISVACLFALIFIGKGSLSGGLMQVPVSALLLLPLSGCLGFVTAKEAFCFQLFEGYLLAMIMPFFLVLAASGILDGQRASSGMTLIAAMLVFFTLRKAFMPLAFDIGDKSAYH
ncbi:MAG: DUF2301 domain-containing membrane protein [Nitrospirota bacterium]